MASCNSTDILATAYRNGYAKLSSRDLMVAAIASACSTCNAQPLIETAIGLGYLKLSEFDAAMCIAESLCSSPGVTAAPAPTILKLAMQDHLAAMSRRDLDGVIAALLCKMTNPPCVTPATPGTPAAFSTLNTIIKISWAQPPNSGGLILNYTVSYGTTQGGPYTNTLTASAMSKFATLSGLTSGTTYYFVVKANSFTGCSSANSAEGSASTTGSIPICNSGVTFANAWSARVVANGGAAPSQATLNAIANFQCGLITDGLDTQMISWNAFVPDNLTAALTPQLLGAGIDPWQNPFPIPAGNLSVNGLTGVAGSASLGTNLTPANTFSSIGSTGLCVYAYTANATGIDVGVVSGTNRYELASKFSDNNAYDWNGLGTSQITLASPGNGWYSSQRVSNTDHRFFFATSISPHAQIGATDVGDITGLVLSNVNGFVVFAVNNGGVIAGWSGDTLSFVGWTKGLTAAQDTALFARVQALRTALGGGFR